ncbi:hypothetical protein ABTM32_23375, partial [Acinetobacter baumannii]
MTARRRTNSLLVAGRRRDLADIRFDDLAGGEDTGDVQSQDVACAMSNNARPLMVQSQVVIEA